MPRSEVWACGYARHQSKARCEWAPGEGRRYARYKELSCGAAGNTELRPGDHMRGHGERGHVDLGTQMHTSRGTSDRCCRGRRTPSGDLEELEARMGILGDAPQVSGPERRDENDLRGGPPQEQAYVPPACHPTTAQGMR